MSIDAIVSGRQNEQALAHMSRNCGADACVARTLICINIGC